MNAHAPARTLLADERGLSRVEMVCIVGISLFAVALLIAIWCYGLTLMHRGNDANALNTAASVAHAHVPAACIVEGCSGGGDSQHLQHSDTQGNSVVYYNKATHTLVADMPTGYNEGDVLVVDGKEQQVQRDTCVIEITVDRNTDEVSCTWVFAD